MTNEPGKQNGHRLDAEAAGAPAPSMPVGEARFQGPFGLPRNSLNNRFVYAVISQRARGLSIGINLNPDKRCNFDCAYCEVNRDTPGRDRKVDLNVMAEELERLLKLVQEKRVRELPGFRNMPEELLELKEVALSGNGEPTLCPDFAEVVREICYFRSTGRYRFFKIVLITNTTGLDLPEVRRGLKFLSNDDEIWVKLDAGTQEYMNVVNRADIPLWRVLDNILAIAKERPVIVQSLFPLINGQQPPAQEIEEYAARLKELKAAGAQISMVQVYSAHRPPHRPHCEHLPLKSLSQIARRVREVAGLKAEVF
jgi:wyosine [tRNA(Phe)-imidazoG37] synthetase (radical SAM superfamily)